MKYITQLLCLLAVLAMVPAHATTYYVRTDGASATQCTGLADAAYPGSGTGQACAWDTPMEAMPPWASNQHNALRIAGGDTLIIDSGSYMIGYSAQAETRYNANICATPYPYACVMQSAPGGPDAAHPTIIKGASCVSPPILWGTEGASQILTISNVNNVTLSCLEITDHSSCIPAYNPSPAVPGVGACDVAWAAGHDVGQWASEGVHINDATNVTLDRLNIHGLNTGVRAGRLHGNVPITSIRLWANSSSGFNGDLGGNDESSTSDATVTFSNPIIAWNGCSEPYPVAPPIGCFGQDTPGTQGGYGDGLGLAWTAGNWTFYGTSMNPPTCLVYRNTSDGLDLLYANTLANIKVDRCWLSNNVGNDVKTGGVATITNNVIDNHCKVFVGSVNQPIAANPCRAGGGVLLDFAGPSETTVFSFNTLISEGNCAIISDPTYHHGGNVVSSDVLDINNNIIIGKPAYNGQGNACFLWSGDPPNDPATVHTTNNIVWQTRNTTCNPPGINCIDPQLTNETFAGFDPRLGAGSPAIGAAVGTPPPPLQ